ncbi:MAG: aquaporin family protein [Micrococcales bacterium]|nr:aquaporin family protein [Micrococcales bacterium]
MEVWNSVFWPELVGTALLCLLGGGVVANVTLAKTKGFGGGFLMVNLGWGLAVMTGVFAAYKSGGHLNPAVTLGVWIDQLVHHRPALSAIQLLAYPSGQLTGAFIGACGCYLAYKLHFDAEKDPAKKLSVFATGPAIRTYRWNLVTEVIATFVLVMWVVISNGHWAHSPGGLNYIGPLGVTLLVVGIGASLGGPTGYAINPARDLGPRLAHAILPIKNKGGSDWRYSWVPVVGPLAGGLIAGLTGGLV